MTPPESKMHSLTILEFFKNKLLKSFSLIIMLYIKFGISMKLRRLAMDVVTMLIRELHYLFIFYQNQHKSFWIWLDVYFNTPK